MVRAIKNFCVWAGLAAVILALACACGCARKLNFTAEFYYVCYDYQPEVHSAASVSGEVRALGGAGYVIECGGEYLVTVACYYGENAARSVVENLKRKGVKTRVFKREIDGLPMSGGAAKHAEKYRGNLTAMHGLSVICYNLANSLDLGEVSQSAAKGVLADAEGALSNLCAQNVDNCFSSDLARIKAECADARGYFIYPADVRRLQVIITDCIAHARLF